MKKKSKKPKSPLTGVGIQPIAGATRYTIKDNKGTHTFDVIKPKRVSN